jgi:L-amino acid N-acyltransferase YncA
MADADPQGAAVVETLDGSLISIRPIEPADAPALRRAFGHLSDRSRFRRFLAPVKQLTDANLAYLTQVDHTDHEALVAVCEAGEIVGVARYIRIAERPSLAEVAVTVVDAWQGRGVGTALLGRLARRAAAADVRTFLGICLEENEEMVQLFRELAAGVRITHQDDGTVEVETELPDDPADDLARQALRAVTRPRGPSEGGHVRGV